MVTATLDGIPGVEVIVVDDGSSDSTSVAVQQWIDERPACSVSLLSLARHSGKGAALRTGIIASKGQTVSYLDADLEIPAAELLRLYRTSAVRVAPTVVVGSKRHHTWRAKGVPLPRRVISVTFSFVVRCLFSLPIRDTQTGLKLFPGPWLRSAVQRTTLNGFLFDLALLIEARRARLEMIEEHVAYRPRRSENRIHAHQLLSSVKELLALYFRSLEQAPRHDQTPSGGEFYAHSEP